VRGGEPAKPTFRLTSAEEGRRVLDRFNAFHDGFIRRIEIVSRDRFEGIGVQTASGVYDVTIELAHYNYGDGQEPFHPVDQVIEARFSDVEDVYVDLAREYLGSSITALYIEADRRRRGLLPEDEECLALLWGRNRYLEEDRKYDFRKDRLFTFSAAVLREL
jgi:hypothetical protein